MGYALFGGLKFLIYMFLSPSIEPLHIHSFDAPRSLLGRFGLHRSDSRAIVTKLSMLFVIDAFAGGFVMQTIIVYWFHVRWDMNPEMLGSLMSVANVLAGLSALVAAPLVGLIGPINTMVVTHFPSNILLLLVPLMPGIETAVVMLLLRFTISQMDVPARQVFVTTAVAADERSAAGGITAVVRSAGLSVSPIIAGYLLQHSWLFAAPFMIAGGLKCFYDILLFLSFTAVQRSSIPSEIENEYSPINNPTEIETVDEPHIK